MAELAARHVAVDRLAVELEPGGQALDDAGQAGAVGLAGGDEAQRHAAAKLIASVGTRPERANAGDFRAALGAASLTAGASRRAWPVRSRDRRVAA